jgi:hypothetical protein
MKTTFLILLLGATFAGYAQTPELKTTKYAGTYSFGQDIEKETVGRAIVYPESDSTVLFFIDIAKSAPTYNIGQHYGRLTIRNGQGIYFSKKKNDSKGCKWKVTIDNDLLTIKTLNNCDECSFGHTIYADNQYKRKFNGVPGYFTDVEGRRVYFDKTSPEDYLK